MLANNSKTCGQKKQPGCRHTAAASLPSNRPRKLSGLNAFIRGLGDLLHKNRRAVAKHLGDAGRDFRGVITYADHRVRPELPRVGQHQVERILARSLAKTRVERYVAAKNALDARAKIADHRARTHHDATHHAK